MAQERPGAPISEPRPAAPVAEARVETPVAPRRTLRDRVLRRNRGPQGPAAEPAEPVARRAGEARVQGPEPRRIVRRSPSKKGPLVAAGLAAGLVGGVILFHDDLGRAKDNLGAAISGIGKDGSKEATPTTSSAAADGEKAKAAREKEIADAVAKALKERDQSDAEKAKTAKEQADAKANQAAAETYALLNIESRQWAATNLGADEWSKNPNNWDEPVVTPQGDKFIHLKQRSNEVHSRVKMTDKTVGQSWIKIKRTDSGIERFVGNQVLDAQAEVLILSPNVEADVKEVTVRMADNVNALLNDSVAKMVAKEAAEQPGVKVVLICPPSEITAKGAVGSYSLLDIPTSQGSAEQWAADNFGVKGDGWSDKATSWEVRVIDGDKFAHLKQGPNEVHSSIKTTDNAVGQAWAKIKRTDAGVETIQGNKVTNAQAEAFVVLPNVTMEVKEITIRLSNNVNALIVDSYNKMVAKEAIEQPEVKVLIACPVTTAPTPTPILPPAK